MTDGMKQGVWISVLTKLPRLNKWVVIFKDETFYKAKRSGTKDNWIWRVDKGDRFLGQDVLWWMRVGSPDEEREKEKREQELSARREMVPGLLP